MAYDGGVLKAIERLNYRVTTADVAAEAGLALEETQQQILALATDVQAHLQVSEAGEIAYEFPKNIQGILLSKSWRLRLRSAWERVWGVLFYLIRISFGILLILSLVLIAVALIAIAVAASSSRQSDDRDGGGFGGGMIFMPRFFFGPDLFWFFHYDYGPSRRRSRTRQRGRESDLNFLEGVFSFLFGDGNPNEDLEDRRWQAIATVIRNNRGAVTAEQIAPYLDDLGEGWDRDLEDFMIPVLSRFNGQPEVSPQGGIVYRFPELQVSAEERRQRRVPDFLQELPRRFSQASTGQIMTAIGLGGANLVGALALGSLLQDPALVAELGGIVAFVNSIYWLLLGYGVAFLSIPLVRYFWVQQRNQKIAERNDSRQARSLQLQNPSPELREKIQFAQQFATQSIVGKEDLAYTTETDLIDQEIQNRDKIDEEWQRRLQGREELSFGG
ncbi:hypothetical protein C7271_11790, partial [filamentous cyanobacterium CCP5]